MSDWIDNDNPLTLDEEALALTVEVRDLLLDAHLPPYQRTAKVQIIFEGLLKQLDLTWQVVRAAQAVSSATSEFVGPLKELTYKVPFEQLFALDCALGELKRFQAERMIEDAESA